MKRVVVTGMGIVSSIGNNTQEVLASLREAKSGGGGHPLINTELGKWMDHMKGDRKTAGKSKRSDIMVNRKEDYWTKS